MSYIIQYRYEFQGQDVWMASKYNNFDLNGIVLPFDSFDETKKFLIERRALATSPIPQGMFYRIYSINDDSMFVFNADTLIYLIRESRRIPFQILT